MSYDISTRGQQFRITAARKAAAFGALKKSGVPVNGGTTTLEDALEELGWATDVIEQKKGKKRKTPGAGDIVGLYFDREHLTDEVEDTLDAIAPFVDEGSYLEFEGEDFCVWRYLFDGVKVEEIYPTVDWITPALKHTEPQVYKLMPGAEGVIIDTPGARIAITLETVTVRRTDTKEPF
jgi:hypothetical protein